MTTKTPITEQATALASQVQSQKQLAMINELKASGLLVPPTFNLAYGPMSFSQTHRNQ